MPKVELFFVSNHPYPWRFRIHYQGHTHEFAGIPNMCSTKKQAAMRASWRARWLTKGEFNKHYQ